MPDSDEARSRSPAASNVMPTKQGTSDAPAAPMIELNDGHQIPQLGLGVWQVDDASVSDLILSAVNAGYRLIDTAAGYGNEVGVGDALKRIGVPRSHLYVTTKLRNEDQGYDKAMYAFDLSAAKLQVDIVDLFLIHWPCPQRGLFVETWRAMVELQRQGRVRSIGVSNFSADHLERIVGETGVTPVLNQIELHPAFQQHSLRHVHGRYGIATEAWSPLGQGKATDHPSVRAIAKRCKRTPAQVILRWHLDSGTIVIPKTAHPARLVENISVFDFELTTRDRAEIAALDRPDGRIGPDPETFGRMRFLRRLVRRLTAS
jgi:diketogulonate reductase-like aldo/keto reductase